MIQIETENEKNLKIWENKFQPYYDSMKYFLTEKSKNVRKINILY